MNEEEPQNISIMESFKLQPETWVGNYSDMLYNYAISRVFSSEIAEDLVQETFLSALKTYKNFRGESTEKTWLIAILKRKIVDHYRKKSRGKEQSVDFQDSGPFEKDGERKGHWIESRAPKSWSENLETLMENEEFIGVFKKCLAHLPAKWANCFSMKNIDDLEAETICKELGISSSNYWVILHRARLRLRECLEKTWMK